MPRIDRFHTLADVRAEKARLRLDRDGVQANLQAKLELVRDVEFRRALAGDAFGDMLRAWRPLRSIKKILGNSPGLTSSALGLVLGGKANTRIGRMLITVVAAALPLIMDRLGKSSHLDPEKLAEELNVSWGRVKDYVRERRTAKDHEPFQ